MRSGRRIHSSFEGMMPNTGDGSDTRRFAVILGATGLVGWYLVNRLADSEFDGWCLGRRMGSSRYDTPSGFAWKTVAKDMPLDVPAAATVFSLVPIPALPALLGRVRGADRLIALSSSSARFKSESPDPRERDQAQALRRAEDSVRAYCADKGIAWTYLPADPCLRSGP